MHLKYRTLDNYNAVAFFHCVDSFTVVVNVREGNSYGARKLRGVTVIYNLSFCVLALRLNYVIVQGLRNVLIAILLCVLSLVTKL